MKKLIIFLPILILITVISSCSNKSDSKNETENITNVYIGMTIEDFKKLYPTVIPENSGNDGQWQKSENLYGLNGQWSYTFKDGKLDWFLYSNYIDEITEENFLLSLKATEKLIAEYKKIFGDPIEENKYTTEFKDPFEEHHWGYDVLEAFWTTDKMTIEIEFTFFGGKGEYNFIVNIWSH